MSGAPEEPTSKARQSGQSWRSAPDGNRDLALDRPDGDCAIEEPCGRGARLQVRPHHAHDGRDRSAPPRQPDPEVEEGQQVRGFAPSRRAEAVDGNPFQPLMPGPAAAPASGHDHDVVAAAR